MDDYLALAAANEALRQRVKELERILSGDLDRYMALGLTRPQTRVFATLMRREFMDLDEIAVLLSRDIMNEHALTRHAYIQVVRRMRRALEKHDIAIETRQGQGYHITPAMKRKIEETLAGRLFP